MDRGPHGAGVVSLQKDLLKQCLWRIGKGNQGNVWGAKWISLYPAFLQSFHINNMKIAKLIDHGREIFLWDKVKL